MIRDITIGQYYPVKSRIHRLDPRVKIICNAFISCLFVCSQFFPWVCNCDIVSRNGNLYVESPSEIYCKRVKTDRDPSDVYGRYESVFDKRRRNAAAFLDFYDYGRRRSYFGVYGASLNVSCGGSSLMTFTTSPNGLMDGMEKLLNPLNKLHLPVHEVAMIMSIALRFIPILLEETDKIMKAQIARGADFESGNIIQRAKAMIPILVPLFVSAFRRANDLAMAMEARCYHGGEGRTRMKPLKYNGRDKAAYLITILYAAGVFAVGKLVPFQLWIF